MLAESLLLSLGGALVGVAAAVEILGISQFLVQDGRLVREVRVYDYADLNVPMLAERVAMSPRNFARVFSKEMKTTPAKFVERLRVEAARRRLEESQNSMETIAGECGFGNVNSMRTVFQRALKIPPGQYRRYFRSRRRPKR